MRRPEQVIQRQVVAYLTILERQGKLWFTHIGHGGGGRVRGAILRGLGLKAGVADLMILLPGGRAHFLELKAPGGKMSPKQIDFCDSCNRLGFSYYVADSLDVAKTMVDVWLNDAALVDGRVERVIYHGR